VVRDGEVVDIASLGMVYVDMKVADLESLARLSKLELVDGDGAEM